MGTRLLLGCGSIGHSVLDAAGKLPGSTTVLDTDPGRVQALRNEAVAAEQVDITDSEAIGGRDVQLVVVGGDNPAENTAATEAAAAAYPEAYLLVFPGSHPTDRQRQRVAGLADELLNPGANLLEHILPFVEDEQRSRARDLRDVLTSIDGTLGVVTHDNPDPDAIASAVALVAIAERIGTDAEAGYYGEISHQENRAFVNLLDVDLRRFDVGTIPSYDAIALVDHGRPGINDQLPPEIAIDIVLDHHPVSGPVAGRFVDIRPGVGATSTMLAGYLQQFVIEPSERVATALLYGIRVDTANFRRDIVPADFEAAADLLPHADTGILERVESPSVSADTFDTIARAIKRRRIEGATLASCVGAISDRDTLAQAADRLLAMEGITTTLVCGFDEGTIYLSARSRRQEFDLGAAMRAAFDDIGSAGGHTDMAGAQLPMGVFEELGPDDEERFADIVDDVIAERFFEVMRSDVGQLTSVEPTTEPAEEGDEVVHVVKRVDQTEAEPNEAPTEDETQPPHDQ
jgi:nanoRNase/pAp phosphatase (c-di-AMP/oligoRNAs hydrolase)